MLIWCNLSKSVEERGISIGVETTLNAIQNLMETLKLTAEQAMEVLKVQEVGKVKYVGILEK